VPHLFHSEVFRSVMGFLTKGLDFAAIEELQRQLMINKQLAKRR